MIKNDKNLQSTKLIEDLQSIVERAKNIDSDCRHLIDKNLLLEEKNNELNDRNNEFHKTNLELRQCIKQLDEEKRKTEQLHLKIINIIAENYFGLLDEIDKKDSGHMHNCLINNIMSTMQNLSDYHCSVVDFNTHEDSFEYHLIETNEPTLNGEKTIIYPAIVMDDGKTLYKGLIAIYKFHNKVETTTYNVYIRPKKGSEQSIPLKKEDEDGDWYLYPPKELVDIDYVNSTFFDTIENEFETWCDEFDDSALDIDRIIRKADLKRDLYLYPVYKKTTSINSVSDSKTSPEIEEVIVCKNDHNMDSSASFFTIKYHSGTPNNIIKELSVKEGCTIPLIDMDFDQYDHHCFDCWLFFKDNTVVNENKIVSEDTELIASWKPIQYQILVHCVDENNEQIRENVSQLSPYGPYQIKMPSVPGYETPDSVIGNMEEVDSLDPIIITKVYKRKKGHISVQKGLTIFDIDNEQPCSSFVELTGSRHYSISFEGNKSIIASLTLDCIDSYDIQYTIDTNKMEMKIIVKIDVQEKPDIAMNNALLMGHSFIEFYRSTQNKKYDISFTSLCYNNGVLECTYKLKERYFNIYWRWDNHSEIEIVRLNETPKGPKKVTRPFDGKYYYRFSHWKPEVKVATCDTVYNACFDSGSGREMVLKMIDEGKSTRTAIMAELPLSNEKLNTILDELVRKKAIIIGNNKKITRIKK